MAEPFLARCSRCGTAYTSRSWYWLDVVDPDAMAALGLASVETRQCAVPGCHNPVVRISEAKLALALAGNASANDGGDRG